MMNMNVNASKFFNDFSDTLASKWADASTATSQFAANMRVKAASYGNHIYEQLPSASDIQAKASEYSATIQGYSSIVKENLVNAGEAVRSTVTSPEFLESTSKVAMYAGFACAALMIINELANAAVKSQEVTEEHNVCAVGQFKTPEGKQIRVIICSQDQESLDRYTTAFENAITAASAA